MAKTVIEELGITPAEQFEMHLEDAVWGVTGYPHGDLTEGDIAELINDLRRQVPPLAGAREIYAAAEEMSRAWAQEAE